MAIYTQIYTQRPWNTYPRVVKVDDKVFKVKSNKAFNILRRAVVKRRIELYENGDVDFVRHCTWSCRLNGGINAKEKKRKKPETDGKNLSQVTKAY